MHPERIGFRTDGLIASILSVLVCPWLFVASPQAITVFVSVFGAVLGPLFGIMIASYYLVKRQRVTVEDLCTMSPDGSLHFQGGWNRNALLALAVSGTVSIGLALLGAWGVILDIGDWGWLVGALLGGGVHLAATRGAPVPAGAQAAVGRAG